MIGIYRIRNLKTEDCYYGSSKEIEKRWERHLRGLRKNSHENIILQRAWNKYGEESFIFEVIHECDKEKLLENEQVYLNTKYNIGIKSSGGDNISKNPNREKIIDKIKKSIIERYKIMSDDEKIKKFSIPKEKNPNWKGGKTYCECGNKKAYNAKTCGECRDRSGKNNPFYNKSHSEETKQKLSKKLQGKYVGDQNKPISINGIEYRSAGEASKNLNIPMVTIRWRVLSKNLKFKEYKYL